MRVNGDEGTPVPIPNTVVKLIYGDNTWLATAREDNSTRTQLRLRTLVLSLFFAFFHTKIDERHRIMMPFGKEMKNED